MTYIVCELLVSLGQIVEWRVAVVEQVQTVRFFRLILVLCRQFTRGDAQRIGDHAQRVELIGPRIGQ